MAAPALTSKDGLSSAAPDDQVEETSNGDNMAMVTSSPSATPTEIHHSADHSRPVETRTADSGNIESRHPSDMNLDVSSFGDEEWVLPQVPLPPREVFEPVQTFVANAMEEQEKEDKGAPPTRAYRALVDAFRFQTDKEMLCHIIMALRTSANGNSLILLTKDKHARLMHNIVRLNPFRVMLDRNNNTNAGSTAETALTKYDEIHDYTLADAHFYLLLAIASANSVLLVPVMFAIWKTVALGNMEPTPEMTKRAHAALATLMRLCPKAKTEMFQIIRSNVPFRAQPEAMLLRYFKQSLMVVRYLPSIQNQVVELMIEKCLEIDVEIKISDDGEATIETNKDKKGDGIAGEIFEFDDDAAPKDNTAPQEVQQLGVNEMASKLDSLLYLLFQFIESRLTIAEIFPALLEVFGNAVLITHKSKFVQFVVFHACGLDEERRRHRRSQLSAITINVDEHDEDVVDPPFYRDFAGLLVDIVVDPYRATSIRQTASSYLASFVSRAAFVNPQTVCETVAAFLRWAETYMNALLINKTAVYATSSDSGQSSRHSLFYTICQAAFYVMCFRGKEAIEHYKNRLTMSNLTRQELDIIDVSSTRWNGLCGHALRPLRYCLESVKSEFLQLAAFYDLLDSSTLTRIENEENQLSSRKRKKPVSIRVPVALEKERLSGGVGGLGRGKNPLDSFFPFDPYLLRQSHVFIEPYYNHWLGSTCAQPDDPNNFENDHSEDDVSDDDTAITTEQAESDDNCDVEKKSDSGFVASVGSAMAESLSMGQSSPIPSHEERQSAWAQVLSRSRAPSIETGSW